MINKTTKMEFFPKKEHSVDADIVIPDECGDSLWEAVLEQDNVDALSPENNSQDKDQVNDGNSEKKSNTNYLTDSPNVTQ